MINHSLIGQLINQSINQSTAYVLVKITRGTIPRQLLHSGLSVRAGSANHLSYSQFVAQGQATRDNNNNNAHCNVTVGIIMAS